MKNLQACLSENVIEAGCDEAGRGCLSGPVVASAVILNPNKKIAGLDDSKKLNEKNRLSLREEIFAQAIDYGVGIVTNFEIDEIISPENSPDSWSFPDILRISLRCFEGSK